MFSSFFIRRPVFASVIAILITLLGAVSILGLPISQYPNLASPQVTVTASYIGASADVVESTVTVPLEEAINGVEGMRYIQSTSTNDGVSTITVTFNRERDIDIATVDVQNRVAAVLGRLPSEVADVGIQVQKTSNAIIAGIAFYAENDEYDRLFISNYVDRYIRDELKRIEGVGDIPLFGERRFAIRIWLDPIRMAARGLSVSDVIRPIEEQNLQVGAGQIGQRPTESDQYSQIAVTAVGRLSDPEEFAQIIVKRGEDGSLVRLGDVARVELGAEGYATTVRFNGQPAVGFPVFQLPNANALDVYDRVTARLEELSERFPPGFKYTVAFRPTEAIDESVSEVTKTLFEAIVLVVLVILIFLQDWRSTIIPTLTIPVSLIGTFIFVNALGFSINTLTLFGLTLATGLVVDDAIVVIENIDRHIREYGTSPVQSAINAMKEVSGAVIAMTLVVVAVFLPVVFFPGTTGILYQQFALTITFSILISALNALTLTPALSALLLRHTEEKTRGPYGWFNRLLRWTTERYRRTLSWTTRRTGLVLAGFGILLLGTYGLFQVVPSGFVPVEDQGYVITIARAPDGSSADHLGRVYEEVEEILRNDPAVSDYFEVMGFGFTGSGPNRGVIWSMLKSREERDGKAELSAAATAQRLMAAYSQIPGALVFAFEPPPIRGIGNLGGFEFQLQDRANLGFAELDSAKNAIVQTANADPRLFQVLSTFTATEPRMVVEVDRDRARSLDVPVNEILSTMGVMMGSQYVNDFDYVNRAYRVYAQADAAYRDQASDIDSFYVRSNRGAMIPLSNLVRIAESSGPQIISRFNLYRSAEVNGAAGPGVSSGEALDAIVELAEAEMAQGLGYDWSGLAVEQQESGSQTALIFLFALVLVFLVLAAQYESIALPIAVVLSVPLAVLGALAGQFLRGLPNDIFCQVGLVMLVGLASKNAILIVEFAEQLREQGKTAVEAVIEGSVLRLRPILMTSLAFIIGVIPLVIASGAGQYARHSLGTAVFSGMIASTALSLLVVPSLYLAVDRLRRPRGAAAAAPTPTLPPDSVAEPAGE